MNSNTEVVEFMSITEQDRLIDAFFTAYQTAMDSMREAGRIMVMLVDGDPFVIEKVAQKTRLPIRHIEHIEEVGRGKRETYLIGAETPGAIALARCPIATQRQFADPDSRIPVLVKENGRTTTIQVAVNKLSPAQRDQVFEVLPDKTMRLRGPDGQASYILHQEEKAKRKESAPKPKWKVSGVRERE